MPRFCNCSIAATTVWAMFVLSPVMNYSPMDALLASDSKPQFDLDGMSPATLEGRSETHILWPIVASVKPSLRLHLTGGGIGLMLGTDTSLRSLTQHRSSPFEKTLRTRLDGG